MMLLTQLVGGTPEEVRAVADAIMAFWRLDYDHRSIAYHTLHEIQDFTPDLGLGDYNPLTRYEDMHSRIDSLPPLMIKLNEVAGSLDSPQHKTIASVLDELKAASKTDVEKLENIKKLVPKEASTSATHNQFYDILRLIPDNILDYTDGATDRAYLDRKTDIAIILSNMLRRLRDFKY